MHLAGWLALAVSHGRHSGPCWSGQKMLSRVNRFQEGRSRFEKCPHDPRSVCGTHGHDLISSAVEPVGWWSRLTRPSGQYDPVVGVGHGDAGRALA